MDAIASDLPYLLSRHAYACVSGDRLVFLDLGSGEYLALRTADAQPLGAWVRGWPLAALPSAERTEPPVLRKLLNAGLLTRDHTASRNDTAPVTLTDPIGSFCDRPPVQPIRVRAHHVWNFVLAVTSVQIARRCFSLRHIVAYVRRRKRRHPEPADLAESCELVSIFNILYPWLLGKRNECFRNSLMLLQFLAFHGIFPDWIFAVRAEPFFAHCWLQQEGLVLNDQSSMTAALTPIMVI